MANFRIFDTKLLANLPIPIVSVPDHKSVWGIRQWGQNSSNYMRHYWDSINNDHRDSSWRGSVAILYYYPEHQNLESE